MAENGGKTPEVAGGGVLKWVHDSACIPVLVPRLTYYPSIGDCSLQKCHVVCCVSFALGTFWCCRLGVTRHVQFQVQ